MKAIVYHCRLQKLSKTVKLVLIAIILITLVWIVGSSVRITAEGYFIISKY